MQDSIDLVLKTKVIIEIILEGGSAFHSLNCDAKDVIREHIRNLKVDGKSLHSDRSTLLRDTPCPQKAYGDEYSVI